jgi:Xaa-Pro aminopeptidase
MYETLKTCQFTPLKDITSRIRQLQSEMITQEISFSVILHNVGLFYFTGSLQRAVLVVPAVGDSIYLVEKNVERATIETPLSVTPIRNFKDVKAILQKKLKLTGTCGMELDVLPFLVYEKWKDMLGLDRTADISPAVRKLRMVKSPYEIEQMRLSGSIVSQVLEKAGEILQIGLTEVEIAAELEAEGRKLGHQGFLRMRGLNQEMLNIYITHGYSGTIFSNCDVPIPGFGVTHAIPQGPSHNKIEEGNPVLVDYGGGYNGYITDETRVYVLGALKDIFRKAYDVARAIIEDAATFGREGVDTTEIYGRAIALCRKAGLEDHFMGYGPGKVSFIGHGIGLEINELPVITGKHHTTLKEGMTFAYEPKFIFPGAGAVGIEVDFIVRKERLERITDSSIDIKKL